MTCRTVTVLMVGLVLPACDTIRTTNPPPPAAGGNSLGLAPIVRCTAIDPLASRFAGFLVYNSGNTAPANTGQRSALRPGSAGVFTNSSSVSRQCHGGGVTFTGRGMDPPAFPSSALSPQSPRTPLASDPARYSEHSQAYRMALRTGAVARVCGLFVSQYVDPACKPRLFAVLFVHHDTLHVSA